MELFLASTDAGGIWSVGAVAGDSTGNIFFGTGQGVFDNVNDFGNTLMRLEPVSLKMVDHFTPFNQVGLNCQDWDADSGRPRLLPAAAVSPTHPHLMLVGTKEGGGVRRIMRKAGSISLIATPWEAITPLPTVLCRDCAGFRDRL